MDPSPKPIYNETLGGLYYIDEQICSQSVKNSNELKIQNGIIKVTISQNQINHKSTKRRRIITLLQLEQKLNKSLIVFFNPTQKILECVNLQHFFQGWIWIWHKFLLSILGMEFIKEIVIVIYYKQLNDYQVMEYVIKVLKVQEEKIIIIGRSIGCRVAIEMSIKYRRIRSFILLSAFTSIYDVIKENSFFLVQQYKDIVSKLVKERFRNLEKMHKVICPTLLIHEKDDNLVNYHHSIELMKECQGLVHIELFEGMNHNQFSIEQHIISPIKQFLMKIK